MSKQTSGTTYNDSAKSSLWLKPQVRRIRAGQAEASMGGFGADNSVYS